MPWPKGKPRKGYVKGTMGRVQSKADPAVAILADEPQLHGMAGNSPITEPCPRCMYAYADGGYCPECGWMLPIVIDENGTNSGGRL
jgi:hypothetical protein